MCNDIELDRVDIEILFYFYTSSKISPLKSAQIQQILDNLKVKVSYYTVVRRVKRLVDKGFIENGYKYRNSFTYYILPEGIDFLENEIEGLYEEEE